MAPAVPIIAVRSTSQAKRQQARVVLAMIVSSKSVRRRKPFPSWRQQTLPPWHAQGDLKGVNALPAIAAMAFVLPSGRVGNLTCGDKGVLLEVRGRSV